MSSVVCSACDTIVPAESVNVSYPDAGLVIAVRSLGYYGGFYDLIFEEERDDDIENWRMCHDCVVKFFATFPLLADRLGTAFGKAMHPCDADVPCCEFAW